MPKQANSGLKVYQDSGDTKPLRPFIKGLIYFSSSEYLIQMIKEKIPIPHLPMHLNIGKI